MRDERAAAWFGRYILKGLRDLHGANIAYRDVKLENAMLLGANPVLKLIDLGCLCQFG